VADQVGLLLEQRRDAPVHKTTRTVRS